MQNEEKFATELLHESKANGKRWFTMAMTELGVIFVLLTIVIVGGYWYFSLPVDETTTTTEQTFEGEDNSNINMIGGDNYGESTTDENDND